MPGSAALVGAAQRDRVDRSRTAPHYDDEPGAPYAGLMPPGFVDGGISHTYAPTMAPTGGYSSPSSTPSRQRTRLGFMRDAAQWTSTPAQMTIAAQQAILRDMKRDHHGREYLPIAIGDTTRGISPQRGQYAFLLPIPYADDLLQRRSDRRAGCAFDTDDA